MDQIPAKFLRDGAEILAVPLRNIINLSVKLSTFPEECKIVKFEGARTDPKNKQPISLLPLVSKTIEKSIHFQIEGCFHQKNLIYMYQWGFKRNHWTDFCLAQSVDFVLTGMDKVRTGMILVDLQKAFDTLDHRVLLGKMKYDCFRTSVIKCFEFYLWNRKFWVCINNVLSEAGAIKYSVPQGCSFGPVLFLYYVNDLAQWLSEAGSYLYADDTWIFYQYEDVKKWRCSK